MDDLPLLPGYRFSDTTRTNFLVPRTLSYKNGHRIIQFPRFGIGQTYKSDVHLTENERQLLEKFQPELIYGKVRVQETRKFVPNMVLYDKKILRFYGYFKQTIYESPLEHYRVRRVIIYYYLEDDTIAIYEIPYENSALQQGMRVRRHQISKNDQHELYNWRDLNLGQNLAIYGTTYRICDCDQFTREWLESEGIELQCSELIPSDPYTLKLMEKQRMSQNNSRDDLWNLRHKQLDSMDGKMLRFYAILDNQNQQHDILRKFIIHFYLTDNTIEIREIHQTNNGYDPIPIYLHRQIVPKDSAYNIKSFVNLFINKRERDQICYLKPEDLALGHRITIFNQIFFLYDCDTYTKKFYQQNFNPIDINTQRYTKTTVRLPPIPSDIIFRKSENMIPTIIEKDRFTLMENENRVLRYEAMMDSQNENNRHRRFLIDYRLADDLISVYEKLLDDNGCSTKTLLQNIRVPKLKGNHSDSPIYYSPNDFYIGAHIELFQYHFLIINADHYVFKFIQENQQLFSQHVIDSFRENSCQSKERFVI